MSTGVKRYAHRAAAAIIPLAAVFMGVAFAGTEKAELALPFKLDRTSPTPPVWERIADGFERTTLCFKGSYKYTDPPQNTVKRIVEMVVYRIDTGIYPVRVMTALGICGRKKAGLTTVHKKVGAVLTVNGGYFSKEGDPDGMVISNGRTYSDFDEDGGSGAITVYGDLFKIEWARAVAKSRSLPSQALQNGPLLIEPGGRFGMEHIREKFFARTVVALDCEGRLMVGVIRKPPGSDDTATGLNLYETAVIFYNPPESGGLGAVAAINLDGGTSTGLEVSLGEYRDRVRVYIHLPNFFCVMPPKSGQPEPVE